MGALRIAILGCGKQCCGHSYSTKEKVFGHPPAKFPQPGADTFSRMTVSSPLFANHIERLHWHGRLARSTEEGES